MGRLIFGVLLGSALLSGRPDTTLDDQLRGALTDLNAGRVDSAKATLERLTKLRPSDERVWLALAQAYARSGEGVRGDAAAQRAAELGGKDPVILHGLAIYHSGREQWRQAADFEARYAELMRQDVSAPARCVELYLRAGDPREAIRVGEAFLVGERRAELLNALGKAYEANGQTVKALEALSEAVRLAKFEEAYYFDLAHLLLLHEDFARAVQVLEDSRKIFARSAQLELALGVAYYGQRRFAEAVDAFLRTISLAPDVEQPYVFLGRILSHALNRLDEVTARFEDFVKAKTNSYLGYLLLAKAILARAQPDYERAESLLRRSIALNGKHWEAYFELASILERKRDLTGAAEMFETAAKLNPRSPVPHYRLARIYDRLGKAELAASERALHERLTAEEKSSLGRRGGRAASLDGVIK